MNDSVSVAMILSWILSACFLCCALCQCKKKKKIKQFNFRLIKKVKRLQGKLKESEADIKRLQGKLEESKLREATDPLTGLNNRNYMHETIEREIRRAKRTDTTVSLIMLDFDHFKKINDQFGHVTGDLALEELANFILEVTRVTDIAFRYGGEEFLIVLPDTHAKQAKVYAERLREAVCSHDFICVNGSKFCCTISAGVADLRVEEIEVAICIFESVVNSGGPECKEVISAFIEKADRELCKSKENGRNQVTVAGE